MTPADGKIFSSLALWIDPVARNGPEQMACDEALLGCADTPVLRIFRWARPWVSAGYFVPLADAQAARPDLPVCRRWTGGGIVVHEGDFTFSLACPRGEPWSMMRPEESYRMLHEGLAGALRGAGIEAALVAGRRAGQSECFSGPVEHDVVAGSRKIAGGAQRRTKRGLLHQGSLQAVNIAQGFAFLLAGCLAAEVNEWASPSPLEDEITRLTRKKYACDEFLGRV